MMSDVDLPGRARADPGRRGDRRGRPARAAPRRAAGRVGGRRRRGVAARRAGRGAPVPVPRARTTAGGSSPRARCRTLARSSATAGRASPTTCSSRARTPRERARRWRSSPSPRCCAERGAAWPPRGTGSDVAARAGGVAVRAPVVRAPRTCWRRSPVPSAGVRPRRVARGPSSAPRVGLGARRLGAAAARVRRRRVRDEQLADAIGAGLASAMRCRHVAAAGARATRRDEAERAAPSELEPLVRRPRGGGRASIARSRVVRRGRDRRRPARRRRRSRCTGGPAATCRSCWTRWSAPSASGWRSAREVRGLTAQARLSGLILGLLPFGFFAFLWVTSRARHAGRARPPPAGSRRSPSALRWRSARSCGSASCWRSGERRSRPGCAAAARARSRGSAVRRRGDRSSAPVVPCAARRRTEPAGAACGRGAAGGRRRSTPRCRSCSTCSPRGPARVCRPSSRSGASAEVLTGRSARTCGRCSCAPTSARAGGRISPTTPPRRGRATSGAPCGARADRAARQLARGGVAPTSRRRSAPTRRARRSSERGPPP